jgi:hypothetical protein
MLSIFRKSIAVWIVPSLRPFVLLVGATCGCKWVQSIGEITKAFETRSTWRKRKIKEKEKPVPMPLCLPDFTHGLVWYRTYWTCIFAYFYCRDYMVVCFISWPLYCRKGGNVQQTGRLRVPFPILALKCFIDIKLLAAMWPWGRQPLTQISATNNALVVKVANA